jgi:hypothetical protein
MDATFGSGGDSMYEYFLKMWLITNKTQPAYEELYTKAINTGLGRMQHKSTTGNLTCIGSIGPRDTLIAEMEHLV